MQTTAFTETPTLTLPRITRGGEYARGGFTLIEILAVVVIMGICAVIIIPELSSRDDLKTAAASREVMADIVYARDHAITYQGVNAVVFDTAHSNYSVQAGSPLAVLTHPVTQEPFTQTFGPGGSYGLRDSSIISATFTGASGTTVSTLAFDDLGVPLAYHSDGTTETLTSGTIILSTNSYKLQITVQPYTGQMQVATIP